MKTLAVIIIITLSNLTFAQNQESVWVTQLKENSFTKNLLSSYNITSVSNAFPASKSEELKNVKEVTCICNADELIKHLNNDTANFRLAVKASNFETLSLPDDYTLAFSSDYALDLINATGAWQYSHGDSSIQIAISDSNFDLNHEELQGNVTHIDASFSSSNYYHGTAVAVTAAGNTNNSLGKSSIGYNSSVQLRGMNYNSILEATYSGAKVINLSWASGCFSNPYCQSVINEAYNNGSIVVAAAGNGLTCGYSTALVYPAAYDNVIAVSSVGPMDNHERTIGDPNTTHQHNSSVDICAPGYDVALTVASGWYLTGNGSSFAAPYVSGAVALMLEVNPCLSFEDIEYILKETAFELDSLNPLYAGQLGAGRLDAGLAVEMASTFNMPVFTFNTSYNCNETVNIDIVVDSNSFVGTVDYHWNNSSTSQHQSGLSAGTYFCEVINSAGCATSDSIIVQPIASLEIEEEVQDVICFGENTGEIAINIAGGSGVSNIIWNNGLTGQVISNQPAGLYEVTVVDDLGCLKAKEIQIDENPEIHVELLTQDYYSGLDAGAVEVFISGGLPSYAILMNGNTVGNQNIDLTPGIYSFTVTDQVGCVAQAETEVSNEEALSASATENIEINIYPNPSSGDFTIKAPTGAQYVIYSTEGKKILDGQMSNSVSQLALSEGVYLIQVITTNGSVKTEKLVIN